MPGKLSHEASEDGVLIVLRPQIGSPSSLRVDAEEAIRFARELLDDLGEGDGLGAGGRTIRIGQLTIDTTDHAVRAGDQYVPFTPKEYQLVEALALRPGHTLSKEQLFNRMYQGVDEPDMKIVDVFVCKIRNKLSLFGASGQVETVWGRGYRLVEEPTVGSWNPPRMPIGLQAAIMARLEQGPANLLQLWSAYPEAQQQSVRNAIATLRQRGLVHSSGDPRGATYFLARKVAA